MKILLVVAVVGLASWPRVAAAFRPCDGDAGWASNGAQVAPRPTVVYWMNKLGSAQRLPAANQLVAKIAGHPVATKIRAIESLPNRLAVISIDSADTGALTLEWAGNGLPAGHYTISPTSSPKVAHATTSRYHATPQFSGDAIDGLAIKVDVSAMRAEIKLRRDAQAPWRSLDVPVDADGMIRIGYLGCGGNYEPQLLEQGVDIDVALVMADGNSIPVDKLTHVKLR